MASQVTRDRITSAPGHGMGDFAKNVYDTFFDIDSTAPTLKQPDVRIWFSGSGSWLFDHSLDKIVADGIDIQLNDSDELRFGDLAAGDFVLRWDGTDLDLIPAADNAIFKIGSGAAGVDLWIYGSTGTANIQTDASADIMKFDGVDLQLQDSDELRFGDLAAGDFVLRWDGTDLDLVPAADNSIFKIGTGALGVDLWLYGATGTSYAVWDASADELLFTGGSYFAVPIAAAPASGAGTKGAIKFGTNSTGVVMSINSTGGSTWETNQFS